MECSICYEKFFTPKTKEELHCLINENIKNKSYKEIEKFKNLLITNNHNETHTCPTPNCQCITCGDCWIKITHKGKSINEATQDDFSSINDFFVCPYCKNVDWKYYMNNVFNELQIKVLGYDVYIDLLTSKLSRVIP